MLPSAIQWTAGTPARTAGGNARDAGTTSSSEPAARSRYAAAALRRWTVRAVVGEIDHALPLRVPTTTGGVVAAGDPSLQRCGQFEVNPIRVLEGEDRDAKAVQFDDLAALNVCFIELLDCLLQLVDR
jgi:hypothetical protein